MESALVGLSGYHPRRVSHIHTVCLLFLSPELHVQLSAMTVHCTDTCCFSLYCDRIWPFARQYFDKHVLKVTQSTVGPRLLSRHFSKHVFVTTNNLHGYMQATNYFDGYELAYMRSCVHTNERILQTDIIQGSSVCEQWFIIHHSGREDTCGPARNGASRRQSLIVIIDYNCKEVSINPIINSRTHYY
jgi:hypothetical protein